jgi:Ca2+-transporting ATPase
LKSKEIWDELGGEKAIATALNTSLVDGIPADSAELRREVFGANKLKTIPTKSFFSLWFGNLKDPIIIMLMAAALISTILGVAIPEEREQSAWTEGVAIWVAVLVVSLVGAGNDWHKDRQFQKLNAQKDVIEIKVIRAGQQVLVKNTELVVGDLMMLDTGDKVVADGYTLEVHGLTLDEASLTGEADPIKKGLEGGDPWIRSGTQVTEGSGRVLVIAVGEHSEWGRTMALVVGESGETPLQEKLGVLAMAIGKIGFVVALICFIVLLIRWCIENQGFPLNEFANGPLEFFIFSITIIVVAVPEGLPLAVTISLAYSMGKMMKDNNFVRVLAACETMGGATAICSDKTGTLTENRMTVVEGWFAGVKYPAVPEPADLPGPWKDEIVRNCALNSKAFLVENENGTVGFVGNRTECALLLMVRSWGEKYREIRDLEHTNTLQVYGFTSERKMASVLVKSQDGNTFRLYNKGAADWILNRSIAFIDSQGNRVPMDDAERAKLMDTVTEMASRGLRTLCLAYKDYPANVPGRPADFFEKPDETELTAMCIVGIKDPVRKEVPEAVATCQRAGIRVRMVTGDNIHTAQHIARDCGILTDGLAMEGPDFRKMSEDELMAMLPKLQVLARSSPQDKYILVQTLKKMGEVVAVTGDGTNDAPALKESDVGLAMGIAGTEVAKEAADIVILDDNFSSIVKSVLWGRTVFSNIRKFLQFQLTINLVALIVAFVAAVTTGETPLNVLQLLWVNLIMDSLAALALATEMPTPDLLNELPHGRNEPLINGKMAKHIIAQGLYQCFWLFLIFYGMPAQLDAFAISNYVELEGCGPEDNPTEDQIHQCEETMQEKTNSMVFNTFIWMQLFNEINARRINDEYDVFRGIFRTWIFPSVWIITVGLQVVIMVVEPVGNIFKVEPQSGLEWGVAIAIGAGGLVVSFLVKLVSRTFFKTTAADEAARYAKLQAQPILYREHFWQIMRPTMSKERKKELKEKAQLKESLSGTASGSLSNNGSTSKVQAEALLI